MSSTRNEKSSDVPVSGGKDPGSTGPFPVNMAGSGYPLLPSYTHSHPSDGIALTPLAHLGNEPGLAKCQHCGILDLTKTSHQPGSYMGRPLYKSRAETDLLSLLACGLCCCSCCSPPGISCFVACAACMLDCFAFSICMHRECTVCYCDEEAETVHYCKHCRQPIVRV
jgi:hypothetical protein